MKSKKFKDACGRVLNAFDGNEQVFDNYPSDRLLHDLVVRKDSILKSEDPGAGVVTLLIDCQKLSLAIGFVIGQMVEITYPGAQKDIETIKGVLRSEGLLPYLPAEKKTKKAKKAA